MAIKCPKDKDELIVRQSQMERAIELYTLLGAKPTVQEVCRLSQILTEFIFNWDTSNEDLKNFSNHIQKQLKNKQDESRVN
jgi:hypothetical protein